MLFDLLWTINGEMLQNNLHDLSKWIMMSRMKLNFKKCNVIWFSIKSPFAPFPPVLQDDAP